MIWGWCRRLVYTAKVHAAICSWKWATLVWWKFLAMLLAIQKNPEGPGIEKNHSRSNAWKNHSPTHKIFILAWNFHSRFENFILDWKVQSQTLFFCGQRGARNEKNILDWTFHSVLKAWFFQYRLSRLNFFSPGALWERWRLSSECCGDSDPNPDAYILVA